MYLSNKIIINRFNRAIDYSIISLFIRLFSVVNLYKNIYSMKCNTLLKNYYYNYYTYLKPVSKNKLIYIFG